MFEVRVGIYQNFPTWKLSGGRERGKGQGTSRSESLNQEEKTLGTSPIKIVVIVVGFRGLFQTNSIVKVT